MNPIISVSNLTIKYKQLIALDKISIDIFPKDYIIILGANGSGKTTFLKSLLDLSNVKKIGYIPQNLTYNQRIPLVVEDIVAFGRYTNKRLGQNLDIDDKKIIQKAMEEINILHLSKRPIGELSGGEQQKVQIARILCQDPEILFLDEPLTHLDFSSQLEILNLIEKIYKDKNLTILLIMHDIQLLPKSCNRSIIFSNGQIKYDGETKNIFNHDNLKHLYKDKAKLVSEYF